MSALALPANGFRADIWYFLLSLQYTLQFRTVTEFDASFGVAGENVVISVGRDGALPEFKVAIYGDVVIIVLRGGPHLFDQLLPQRLSQDLVAWAHSPGHVTPFYRDTVNLLWDAIAPTLSPILGARKVIVTGHSLGGALAPLLGALIARDHPGQLEQVVSWGSPRVGTEAFAAGYPHPYVNVSNVEDHIFDFPPAGWQWMAQDLTTGEWAWTPPIELGHAGILYRMTHDGAILNASLGRSFDASIHSSLRWPWRERSDLFGLYASLEERFHRPTGWDAHLLFAYLKRVRSRLPHDLSQIARRFGWRNLRILDEVNRRIAERQLEPWDIVRGRR